MKWLAPLGLAFFVSGCTEPPEPEEVTAEAQGKTFSISWIAAHPNHTSTRIGQRVRHLIVHVQDQFSEQREFSELARLNSWQTQQPFVLTRELEQLLQQALRVQELSEHRIDVTGHGQAAHQPMFRIDNHQLYKALAEVEFSLDIMLNGHVVDRIADLMDLMNIQHYRIQFGDELRVQGYKQNNSVWPLADVSRIPRSVRDELRVQDQALSVKRAGYSAVDSQALPGLSPRGAPYTVLVAHHSAAIADALGQLFLTMPAREARELAERQGIAALFLVGDGEHKTRYNSLAFEPLLE